MREGNISAGIVTAQSFIGNLTGNASTSSKLLTARTLSTSGDATGSVSFDGSADAAIPLTLATVNTNVGSFGSASGVPVLTVNAKGLVTAVSTASIAVPSSAITDATAANAPNMIVKRNSTGSFAANSISLSGSMTVSSVFASVTVQGNELRSVRSSDNHGTVYLGDQTPGARYLNWNAGLDLYVIPNAPLQVNGALVWTAATLVPSTPSSANTVVLRDISGNFSAGTITANLSGNAATATKLQTARTVTLTGAVNGSGSFDGSADLSIATTSVYRKFLFYADQLDSPTSADWSVNNLAPATNDATNTSLVIRAFDDTAEEGVGFTVSIPAGTTSMILGIRGRAATAPTSGTPGAVMRLHRRTINTNAAISAWSITTLTTLTFPLNAFYQTFTQTLALSTIGATAGALTQFELTRQGSAGADTLVGDFNVIEIAVEFI